MRAVHRSGARDPRPAAEVDDRWWSWRTWWTSPSAIRSIGTEPDYRFSLANERTLLAWIRTSLAMLAGGVAVVEIVPQLAVPGDRHMLGVPLVLLSIIVSLSAYRHWALTERALRLKQPLPSSPLPRLLGIGVSAISILALVLVIAGSAKEHP